MKVFEDKRLLAYEGRRTLIAVLGAAIYAAGTNLFIVPSGLYSSGVMGLCQILRTLLVEYLHLSFGSVDIAGMIYYIINIPIFIVGYKKMGKKFLLKTLICVTTMSVGMAVIPVTQIVEDTMLACVIGGIICGAGVGILLRMGASGGGMDIVGVILVKWRQDFSVGKVNLAMNLALYSACLFLFDVETALYSVINAAVYSVAIDKLHSQNINVEVNVITKISSQELEKEVFSELGRGITKWKTMGAYTHEESHILYIMMSKYEVHQLRNIVHKYDPQAFIVINEGVHVEGNYLKKL
ncbi:MAG: YitT family protein [Acetatifactor sp.]|nr:YitT family protein [Acetatifactor sp.]